MFNLNGFLSHHVLLYVSKLVPQTHNHANACTHEPLEPFVPWNLSFEKKGFDSNTSALTYRCACLQKKHKAYSGRYSTVGLLILLWYYAVWMCVRVCEKCFVQLCGAEVFVPWDLSVKELRWCKPSKGVIQDHILQRLSSQRLYLHHIAPLPLSPLQLLSSKALCLYKNNA